MRRLRWMIAILTLVFGLLGHFVFAGAAEPLVREFDARITGASAKEQTLTVHHNATQFDVTLKVDAQSSIQCNREVGLGEVPVGKLMRFWGPVEPEKSAMTVQGIRRSAGDDALKPEILKEQHYAGGRLVRKEGKLFIEAGGKTLAVTIEPNNFEAILEEPGSFADIQPGRRCHVRYEETKGGGRLLGLIIEAPLPGKHNAPSLASGVTAGEVRKTFAQIGKVHEKIAPELARLMPVTMSVTPELAKVGEKVTLRMEALADRAPSAALELYPQFFKTGMTDVWPIRLDWKASGQRGGLTVYRATAILPAEKPGSYLLHWKCDISGDTPEFWRYFAIVDDSYAVCMFMSTSHASPAVRPAPDFHRLHVPYEEWVGPCLSLGAVLQGNPAEWAGWSHESRQYGMKINPMLFSPSWVTGPLKDSMANFQAEPEEVQRAILAGYRQMLPRLGFGPVDFISAYTMGKPFARIAREEGYAAISSLCPGQNFMDGPMRINHFGMPDRPYFMDQEDFRKAGGGGPKGLVGLPQCTRNTFLCREFNCTYSLEPAWNDYFNKGGGREKVDELWMSRMYDFFDAMLQNRLSQKSPYFFNVGLEFNGNNPGITEGNRKLIEYAAKKAAREPLVFATGPAVSDYYRRHYTRTPESTCYQQDYFGGLTNPDKFPGYPDMLEIEGAAFQSLFRAPDLLPAYHYDYTKAWDCPDWGNDGMPRNKGGYLYPGQHDPFKVVPKILDTRLFKVRRSEEEKGEQLTVTVSVEAKAAQKNLTLALWEIPRQWRAGEGWWSVAGKARFVPVRAPFSGNLNGILVVDVKQGENQFAVTIRTPRRQNVATTIQIADGVEGRVFRRDGELMAYLWPKKPWAATLAVKLPAGKQADAYIAPKGERQALKAGEENRFTIPMGGWMRIVGLSAEELAGCARAF